MGFAVGVSGLMDDLISRQDAIRIASGYCHPANIAKELEKLPSAQPEPHYCRECKWSMCHINVDKYGSIKTYWHCLYWAGETDEEGFCHEWERKGEQP